MGTDLYGGMRWEIRRGREETRKIPGAPPSVFQTQISVLIRTNPYPSVSPGGAGACPRQLRRGVRRAARGDAPAKGGHAGFAMHCQKGGADDFEGCTHHGTPRKSGCFALWQGAQRQVGYFGGRVEKVGGNFPRVRQAAFDGFVSRLLIKEETVPKPQTHS